VEFDGALVNALAFAVAGGRESLLILPWALLAWPDFQPPHAASDKHAMAVMKNLQRIPASYFSSGTFQLSSIILISPEKSLLPPPLSTKR
jgi:hypothetical protein